MPAGRSITIAEPYIWFSPNPGTQVLPDIGLAYKADWPTGFVRIPFTVNGAQWTMVNPKQDIPSDEVGILDTVPSGADTVNVTLQARTPTADLIEKIAGFAKQVATARTHVETFTATSPSTGAGTVLVSLPGGPTNVSITLGATDTTTAIATAVRAASYTGWTTSGTGVNVIFTASTAGSRSGSASFTLGTATGAAGTFASPPTVKGRAGFSRYTLDPSVDNSFILGMDGKVAANSLTATGGRMRLIAYNAEQTDNPQLHMRTRGSDSLMQPVLTARCLNSVLASAQTTGTDIDPLVDVDQNGRFDFYLV